MAGRLSLRFDSVDLHAMKAAILAYHLTDDLYPPRFPSDPDGLVVRVCGPEAFYVDSQPLPIARALEITLAVLHPGMHLERLKQERDARRNQAKEGP